MQHAVIAFLLLAGLACGGGGKPANTLDSIPRRAAEAIREQAHGMTIERVERAQADGGEVFEATWYEGGVRHVATVNGRGVLIELAIDVTADQVPAAVRDTATRELGSTEAALHFVRLRSGNFAADTTITNKVHAIEIKPDGTIVEADKPDADKPDADKPEAGQPADPGQPADASTPADPGQPADN